MFEFYRDCSFNYSNAISRIAICSALIALGALIISIRNLNAVKRSQCVQSHLSLINLENELRKNKTSLKSILERYTKATSPNSFDPNALVSLSMEKDIAFELYISSVDKLASLINAVYLQKQFKGKRNWRDEYLEIFREAKTTYDGYPKLTIAGRDSMIRNLNKTLDNWN